MRNGRIREIEQLAMRAWPALETETYDGWILRYGRGYTRRNNSVNPLLGSTLPIDEKIAHCEARYEQHGLPCLFRFTPAVQPSDLEDVLAEHGYRYQDDTLVQTLAMPATPWGMPPEFRCEQTLSTPWLRAYMTMNGIAPRHEEALVQMLHKISAAHCFGWLGDFAVGLAVVEAGYVGLFDIVVAPEQRGKGYGRALVTSLLSWAAAKGAQTAYLQVVTTNAPARKLYESLGFHTHHRYWYWARE